MLEPKVPMKDPCPCGSGRKYKNCCWRRRKREYAAFREALKRTRKDLYQLMWDEREEDFFDTLYDILKPLRTRQGADRAEEIVEEVEGLLIPFIADVFVADVRKAGGRCLVDEYLARRGGGLEEGVVEFLESWRDANVSLCEVREVVKHSHVVLKDLFSNRLHRIGEAALSEAVSLWDALLLRVVSAGGHEFVSGPVLPVYREMLNPVLRSLEKYHDEYGNRSLSWKRLLKRDWWLSPEIWIELVEQELTGPEPEMVNADGDPVESVRVAYYLHEGAGMMATALLEKIPEVSRESDGSLAWIEEKEEGSLESVLVARITHPDESTLVLHTNSRNREERVGIVIEEWLGSMIDDVDVAYGPYAPEEMAPDTGIDPDDLSPGELADIKQQMIRKIYGRWPDQHLPALKGMTPREAADDPRMRPEVVSLLKDIESTHIGMDDALDFEWLWKELGLKRP